VFSQISKKMACAAFLHRKMLLKKDGAFYNFEKNISSFVEDIVYPSVGDQQKILV